MARFLVHGEVNFQVGSVSKQVYFSDLEMGDGDTCALFQILNQGISLAGMQQIDSVVDDNFGGHVFYKPKTLQDEGQGPDECICDSDFNPAR